MCFPSALYYEWLCSVPVSELYIVIPENSDCWDSEIARGVSEVSRIVKSEYFYTYLLTVKKLFLESGILEFLI